MNSNLRNDELKAVLLPFYKSLRSNSVHRSCNRLRKWSGLPPLLPLIGSCLQMIIIAGILQPNSQ